MQDVSIAIRGSGTATADDISAIRRAVFADGSVRAEELRGVIEAAREIEAPSVAWRRLVTEMCEDHFLLQDAPNGYFSPAGEELAADLFADVGNHGCRTLSEALIHLLYKCAAAPEGLARLAMARIERDVLEDGRVCAEDVALTRKLLYAQGSLNGLGICRDEAELLFRLNDYSYAGQNDPEWIDLSCKGIGCHLMVQHGWVAPPRERALDRERWLEDTSISPMAFITRGIAGLFGAFGRRDRECLWTERNERFEADAAAASVITDEEANWLAERIGHEGTMCDAERALVAYVSSLCEVDLPARLGGHVRAAGDAARMGAA